MGLKWFRRVVKEPAGWCPVKQVLYGGGSFEARGFLVRVSKDPPPPYSRVITQTCSGTRFSCSGTRACSRTRKMACSHDF